MDSIYAASALMILVFILPGLVVNLLSGMRTPWALASSIPVSLGLLGFLGWWLGRGGQARFDEHTIVLGLLVICVLALLWRVGFLIVPLLWRRLRRREPQTRAPVASDTVEGKPHSVVLSNAEDTSSQLKPQKSSSTKTTQPQSGAKKGSGNLVRPTLEDVIAESKKKRIAEKKAAKAAKAAAAAESPTATVAVAEPPAPVATEPAVVAAADTDDVVVDSRPSLMARALAFLTRPGSLGDPVWILPAAGVLTGMWLLLSRALDLLATSRGGVMNIYQGWDVQWHANEVAYIINEHMASATRMGELMNQETQGDMYYPSAWHALVGFAGMVGDLHPIAATNLAGIVMAALLLPLSAATLTWRILDTRSITGQMAAGLAGLLIAAVPSVYWIGLYVGAWPYLAGIAACGIVVSLFTSITVAPLRMFGACWAFAGVVQTHPSAATVVVVPVGLWWLTRALITPSRRAVGWKQHVQWRLQDLMVLAITGLAGTVLVLPQILAGARQTGEVESFAATEDVTRSGAWEMAAFLTTRHAGDFATADWLVWWALAGAVIALLWRGSIWSQITYVISLAVTVNAIKPFDDPWQSWLSLIGSLHYNTPHRLIMPVGILVACGAAIAIACLISLIAWLALYRWPIWHWVACAVVACAVAVGFVPWIQSYTKDVSYYSMTQDRSGRMVDATDLKAFDWLAKQPHAFDGVIVGDPADGMGWMYAYNQLPSLYRHYLWPNLPEHSDTAAMFWFPHKVGAGNLGNPNMENTSDIAANRLGVKYFYVSPPTFWAFQLPNDDLIFGLWDSPGVTPVYHDKQVTIFAYNPAFTDEQLIEMRKKGNSPEPLPPLTTRAEAGVAKNAADGEKPYFHRPTEILTGPPEIFHSERAEATDKLLSELFGGAVPGAASP